MLIKRVCSGRMTMGDINGEVIHYFTLKASRVVVVYKPSTGGLFRATIFAEVDDETGKVSLLPKVLRRTE